MAALAAPRAGVQHHAKTATFAVMSWPLLRALTVSVCFSGIGCGQAAAPPSQAAAPPSEVESAVPTPEAPTAPAGKRAPCTLGADQTCNDDERVSSLWGHCTELGVCECSPGFELNPRGRCQQKAP
jgi:hypothetical protein